MSKYKDEVSILKRAQEATGIPFGKIDKTGRINVGLGAVGTVIEESWFEIGPNSISEPDFKEAGVELKVTPFVRTRNGISAKERLVCNIIDYMDEATKTFDSSSFWHKCKRMLIMSYEHKYDVEKKEYCVEKSVLFSFPEADLEIIKHDWNAINKKIREGKADQLSEGDTMYLGACTKGANAHSYRNAPMGIVAMQRAYSLKSSYMTYLLRNYIFGDKKDVRIVSDWHELQSAQQNETSDCSSLNGMIDSTSDAKIIKNWHELHNASFESIIENRLKPYYGKTIDELSSLFKVESSAKNIVEILLGKMLGIDSRVSHSEEFIKAGILPKTVRLLPNGKSKESMSFAPFSFLDIVSNNWEDDDLYDIVYSTKFMFIVFQSDYTKDPMKMVDSISWSGKSLKNIKHSDDIGVTDFIFKGVMFWNMPRNDCLEVEKVWEKTQKITKDGPIVIKKGNRNVNNFPKSSENPVAHVRPHGKNAADVLPLPNGGFFTKQSFWLNADYVTKQVNQVMKLNQNYLKKEKHTKA